MIVESAEKRVGELTFSIIRSKALGLEVNAWKDLLENDVTILIRSSLML